MCVQLPTLPLPILPAPLTLGAGIPAPSISLNPAFCCQFSVLTIPSIPIGLPLFAAAVLPIVASLASIREFLDSFAIACPLE